MDIAVLPPTSNGTTENADLLGKRAELQTTPEHTRDGQNDTAAEGSIRTDTGKDSLTSEQVLRVTDWTLFSQTDDSLKNSIDKSVGSAESALKFKSSQSTMPLEWKTRSYHSQGTLTHFSDDSLESIEGENKPVPEGNQEVVDDVIEDEADFKVGSRMLKHSFSANYTVDSRTNIILPAGSPKPNDTKDPQQGSDGTESSRIDTESSRTEKLSEFGSPVNRIHNSGADQEDSSVIDQLWTTVSLSKNLSNTNTAPTGSGSNSNNHEPPVEKTKDYSIAVHLWEDNTKPVSLPVLSPSLLKPPNESREKFCQPLKALQTEYQSFLKEDAYKPQWSSPNMSLSDCNFPSLLQQQIVLLKCQIRDLQETKESAVSALAKAHEETSQLKLEMARLKTEYLQKLIDSEEENCLLKRKINRLENSHGPIDTYKKGLHDEISQLRNEARGLREFSHQLNEENHRLQEQLWDVKRQCEWLKHTSNDKPDEKQERCRNAAPLSLEKQDRCRNVSPSSLEKQDRCRNVSPSSLEKQDRCRNSSPSSVNSEFTEMLLTGYYDTAKECRALRDNVCELKKARNNSDNFSCIEQHSQTSQDSSCHSSDQFMSRSAAKSISGMDLCPKFSPTKAPKDTRTISRRPFAPRSVSDLKIGNLVKFSCSKGKISKGTVKYLGPLIGRQEDYIGIELEGNQEGRHDGTFQGTRYFMCERNKGVFVNFNKVIVAWE